MDKIVPGLALAAVSALTLVAYKHPDGYSRILRPIQIILVVLLFAAVIWDTGVDSGVTAVVPYIGLSKIANAEIAAAHYKLLSTPVFIGCGATLLYLEFLSFLPIILAEKQPPQGKDDQEGEREVGEEGKR